MFGVFLGTALASRSAFHDQAQVFITRIHDPILADEWREFVESVEVSNKMYDELRAILETPLPDAPADHITGLVAFSILKRTSLSVISKFSIPNADLLERIFKGTILSTTRLTRNDQSQI